MGCKFIFWEARAVHRSVTHLPWSDNTHRPRSHSHLFNPSSLRLGMSCWLRKYKPRAAFWSLSAVLFCQAGAFLSSDTKCLLSFSSRDPRTLPPAAAPAFVGPRERGSWQDSREPGRDTPLCTAPELTPALPAKGLGRGGSGEFGIPGWRMAENTREGDQNKHSHPVIPYSLTESSFPQQD